MRAFVVLGLFYLYQAERLAWGKLSEMTYFLSATSQLTLSQAFKVICLQTRSWTLTHEGLM